MDGGGGNRGGDTARKMLLGVTVGSRSVLQRDLQPITKWMPNNQRSSCVNGRACELTLELEPLNYS